MRFNLNRDEIDALVRHPAVIDHLRERAEQVVDDATPPSWLEAEMFARAGINDDGEGYAQAIAKGSGAVYAEFYRSPYLRPALDAQRGR